MGQAGLVSAAIITASASILVAVLVFILNLRAQVHQERRQARLARVSSQLRELYGPLNALVDVNERIWEALRESHLPRTDGRRQAQKIGADGETKAQRGVEHLEYCLEAQYPSR
jgi:hypothetical protein